MQPHDDHDIPVLPWSPEAEAGVLGAVMLNNDLFDQVGDILLPTHFFDKRHARVFETISKLSTACKPVDVVSVLLALQAAGHGDIDMTLLNELAQVPYGPSSVRRYAEVIAERSMMRGLIAAAGDVREIAVLPGMDASERLDKAQARLESLTVSRGGKEPVAVGSLALSMLERLQALSDGSIKPGISTGIPGLDKRLNGGLRGGKLIIVAARPAVGKSSLTQQVSINLARSGVPAAVLSLEMPQADLLDRTTSNLGRVFLDNIITGRLHDSEWARVTEAIELMNSLPLYLDDESGLTLADIRSKARKLVRQHKIKLLVLDYIQLCGSRKADDKRHHQIEELTRGLKSLAKELDITIIALSQLNRLVEGRIGGKPQLSDLKESGAIEEDADVVILLSLNHIAGHGGKVIEADFAKNRQGRVGSVPLSFDGGYQRWTDSSEPLSTPNPGPGRSRRAVPYTEEI